MSDYISKSEAIHTVTKVELKDGTFAEVKMGIGELPTLDETEIIRKAFERVFEQLNGLMPIQFNGFGKTLITVEDVIKILKEECGINE